MSARTDTIRVLHVDDEPDFADMAATFLEREDDRFSVETATSAGDGLDRLAAGEFDCIVSDYDMPGQNGIEFLDAVRAEYPELPFVLFTGKGSEEVASDAISAGATDYIQKTSGSSQYTVLANRVANAVDQYRTERQSRERKRELEEQRQLYSTLVEQSPNGVMIVQDKEIVFVNPRMEELAGRSESELLGLPFYEVISADYRELVERRYEQRVRGERPPQRYDIEIVTAEGDSRLIDLHVSRIQYRNDPATLATFNDITDRKQHERELQRERDRLEEFVGVVSHDLRNPLRVAEGRLELVESDSEHLDELAGALDRMDALIEDLLALAREGDRAGELEPVALADLSRNCWRTVATGEATLAVETDLTIRADRSRLKQLLENLYRNAVQHGGDGVGVTVGDLDPDVGTGFYVTDDGVGIPEDDRDRVFEAGYTTSAEGTGFGLSIVKQVVDAHGWKIRVGESPDGGARFEITGVTVADRQRG